MRTPVTYVYFGILLLLGFLFTIATGGAFSSVTVSTGGDKIFANAPALIHTFTSFLSLAGIFITAGIIGPAVFKDFKYQTASLAFTTSISKFHYIIGRFFGAYLVALLVFIGPLIGFYLGSLMPFVEEELFAPNRFAAYLYPYLNIIIPNTFFIGSLFFVTSILRRSVTVNWVVILVLYVGYGLAGSLAGDLDNEWISALIDPIGIGAGRTVTKYWTQDEQNTLLVSLKGWYLANRILWIGIGVGMLAFGYLRFRFNEFRNSFQLFSRSKPETTPQVKSSAFQLGGIVLPTFTRSFSVNAFVKLTLRLAVYEFKQILGSVYFRIIMMVAIVFMLSTSGEIGKLYDTQTYPVTYQTVGFLTGALGLFLLIIIVLYSGEMVWKERDRKVSEIHDALPTPNWVIFASKLLGLMMMQVVLLTLVLVMGIGVQAAKGYTKFEIGLYLQELYTLQIIDL
ncbi:MAG: hypothetical protein KDD63_19395, partial [Bacteroidetes bacterium]|nr:hypothetical protein [Bacteroidota bacterium]